MQVMDVMQSKVVTAHPDLPLLEAGHILERIRAGVLPVVDGDELVGIATDRDMFLGLTTRDARPSEVTVGEVMHRDVVTCAPGDLLLHAVRSMEEHGLRRLPVADHGGRLVGILSLDDVATHARATGTAEHQGVFYANIIRAYQASVRSRQEIL